MKTYGDKIMSDTQISDETKALVEEINTIKSNSAEKVIASKKMSRPERGDPNQQAEVKPGNTTLESAMEEATRDFGFNEWLGHNPAEQKKVAEFSQGLIGILSQFGIASDYMDGYNALGGDNNKLASLIEQRPMLKQYLTENIDQLLEVTNNFKKHIEAQYKETSKIMDPITDANNSIREDQSSIAYKTGKEVFITSVRDALSENNIEGAQEKIYLYFSKTYEFADRESFLRDKEKFNKLMKRDLQQLVTGLEGREAKLIEALVTSQDKLNSAMDKSVHKFIDKFIADNSKKGKETDEKAVGSLAMQQNNKNDTIKSIVDNDSVLEAVINSIAQKYKGPLTEHLQEYSRSDDARKLNAFAKDFKEMTGSISSALKGVKQEVYSKHLASVMKDMVTGIHDSLTVKESFKSDFRRFKNDFCMGIDKGLLEAEKSKNPLNNKSFNLIDKINDLVQSLLTKLHAKTSLS